MKNKLELVQIVRGFAALFVLIYHCTLNNPLYLKFTPVFSNLYLLGWTGVEFFFVLSGFIITFVHLSDLKQRGNVLHFLKKRFIRIYPIYWFMATIMLLYYLFIKKETSGVTVILKSFKDFVYVVKCYLLFPLEQPRKNYIDSAWTLTYELVFYLVFSLSIRLGFKAAKFLFFGWILLILITTNFFPYIISPSLGIVLYPIVLFFLSGCLIAYFLKEKKIKMTLTGFIAGVSITSILFYAYAYISHSPFSETRVDPYYTYLLVILMALLLWGVATMDQSGKFSVLKSKTLLLIGDASYSIYLTHVPCVMFFYKFISFLIKKYNIVLNGVTGNLLFIGIVIIIVFIGVVTHLLIEKPLLSYLNKQLFAKKISLLPFNPPPDIC